MKGKHFIKGLHWNKKRMVIAVLCAALLLTSFAFSTLAWFNYEKKPVDNVFKGTTLEITMGGAGSEFPLVPGAKYTIPEDKVPKIIVPKNNVDCYVFVVADYLWYDLTYYDSKESSFIRPINLMKSPDWNDTFDPNRSGTSGPDDDYGKVRLSGGSSALTLTGRSEHINLDGSWVGQRYILYAETFTNPATTPSTFDSAVDGFSPVFKTAEHDRFVYILEGNSKNCCFEAMKGISKVEMIPKEGENIRYPEMRFTAYSIQAEGLSHVQAYNNVLSDIKKADNPINFVDMENKSESFTFS